MERHFTILGALYLALSAMSLMAGIIVFVGVAGGGLLSGDVEAIAITGMVGGLVGGFLMLTSLPGLILGVGLLGMRPWSRPFGVVMSILHLLHVPFGTILGVYGLVVLLKPEATTFLLEREAAKRSMRGS